jgi:sulfonate transport system substrate-binding protein
MSDRNRRNFLIVASSSLAAALARPAISAEPLKELRIGYQKIGALLIVKEQKVLEQRFESQRVPVRWIEFAFGAPLLEALGAGAIDYGYTGDSPPIFAQAAHANLLYAGAIPARGYGQAIVVPASSSIQDISSLAGKKIAVAKASSAHNLLVAALESVKLPWSAIIPVYLAPPDAAAAFIRGAVDAWSIWDPFLAIAELKQKARALPVDRTIAPKTHSFWSMATSPPSIRTSPRSMAPSRRPRNGQTNIAIRLRPFSPRRAALTSRRSSGPSTGRSLRSGRSIMTFSPSNRLSRTASKGSG